MNLQYEKKKLPPPKKIKKEVFLSWNQVKTFIQQLFSFFPLSLSTPLACFKVNYNIQ